MHEPNELQIKLNQIRHAGLLHDADDARRVAQYLRETRALRSWRFRLAEALLRLATVLSPYHRSVIQLSQKSGGTMVTRS